MPAAAALEYAPHDFETSRVATPPAPPSGHAPRTRHRQHTSPRRQVQDSFGAAATASAATAGAATDWQHYGELVGHFHHDREVQEYDEPDTAPSPAAAPAKAIQHQPVKVSWAAATAIAAVLLQVLALLYVEGLDLSACRRGAKLDDRIQEVHKSIEDTQADIAQLDASPQIQDWAANMGWTLAGQEKFEDVTDLSPGTADALPQSPVVTTPKSIKKHVSHEPGVYQQGSDRLPPPAPPVRAAAPAHSTAEREPADAVTDVAAAKPAVADGAKAPASVQSDDQPARHLQNDRGRRASEQGEGVDP